MANNINALDSLKNEAVRVYTGMTVIFPQFSKEEILNISGLAPKFNGRYAMNNSTVAFVSDGEVYAIPYTRSVMDTLKKAGFRHDYFYVPFSNWDYPKNEQTKWERLCYKAHQEHADDFMSDCIKYCDEHNIRAISDETLAKCFQMPETGVNVKHLYFEDCYYPVITSSCMDSSVISNLGHFCSNNGKVVFVYRDGKTYVAKGYKIMDELRSAGYTKAGLFVPFSNGEEIQDCSLKMRWDSITK